MADLVLMYKAICTLTVIFDGIKKTTKDRIEAFYPVLDFKVHVCSVQKWMILFLNSLEDFIVNNHAARKYRKELTKDFSSEIYVSLYFFNYSLDQCLNVYGRFFYLLIS